MRRSTRALLFAALFLTAQAASAVTGFCTTRSSGAVTGEMPAGTGATVQHAFEIPCRGGIRGELDVLKGQFFSVTLQLERFGPDGWQVMQTGQRISYSGLPGRYRFVVRNGNPGSPASWRLHYSIPF